MIRRVFLVAGPAAIVATMAACSSSDSTGSLPPPETAAEWALHFDTLAGKLEASQPGDPRITWYQDIDNVVALGVSPTFMSARVAGGPAILDAVTEIDAFADSMGGKQVADSTYWLIAWEPPQTPELFVHIRVRFLPAGTGMPDTTAALISYSDSLGTTTLDSTAHVLVGVVNNRGLCQVTPLQHLTIPGNPCTHAGVDWMVSGGQDLLLVTPSDEVSGTHLTH